VTDTRWRAALVGRNGRGKTTLLHLIHGMLTPGTDGHT
jgi:ATPase subunit of ABC transporter with duplicated ATPase domains